MISLLSERQYRNLGLLGGWHLAYYVPALRNTPDTLPNKIIQFKNHYPPGTIDGWCSWAIDSFVSEGLQFNYIVRALGSRELKPTGDKPLDTLGIKIARQHRGIYAPDILYKLRETPPMHTLKTLPERYAALHGAYSIDNRSHNLKGLRVLVLDDVTTSNTTLVEILRALRGQWPAAHYYFFCLGRTAYDESLNNSITLQYFT